MDLTGPRAGIPVLKTNTLEGLSRILEPGCGVVEYVRDPAQAALDWLDALPAEQLPSCRIILRPEAVRAELARLTEALAHSPHRDWFIADVAQLASAFAQLMSAPYLRMRLDIVTTNACRKFHIDAITARLVCTYRGQTTQYGLKNPDGDPQDILWPAPANPLVLRGTRWPGDAPTGLVHRSPPIAGTGETRLLLVLDPMEDLVEPHPLG